MGNQVGSGEVAIVPTFKGFRRAVSSEVDGSAKHAGSGFSKAFSRVGSDSGKSTGAGFKKAFESSSQGFAQKATKSLEADVAKAARAVSAARLKEQDATGKARVAEAQLAEARKKYAQDSSQVIRAQERLESATRQVGAAQENTKDSTRKLEDAQSDLARAADRAGDEFEQAGRRSGNRFTSGFGKFIGGVSIGSFIGNFAANIVSSIGAAIGSGIRTGFDFLSDSVTEASNLKESANAIAVSFGDSAKAIEDLGKGAASRLGLSKVEFGQFATQFSSFASTIRGSDVAGFIDELTTRGADFASVYNIEVGEALTLFQSGLAGETEPLRRFGIDLSAAAVEAYAYANGIGVAGTELTEAQKQQARYGSLLEQTSKTQGDFQNTSTELANQQRILNAEWQNAQAKLGMAMLPALTQLANVATTTLIPALGKIIDEIGPGLGQALTDAMPGLVALGKTIADNAPAMLALAQDALPAIISGLQTLIPWAIQTAAAWSNGWTQITDSIDLWVGRFQNGAEQWGAFFASVSAVWNGIIAAFANGGAQIGAFFSFIGAAFANGWSQISRFFASVGAAFANGAAQVGQFAGAVGAGIGRAIAFVGSLPGRVRGFFAGVGSWLVNAGRDLIGGFIDGIRDMIGGVGDAIGGVLDFAKGFFPHSPAKRGPFSGAGWRRVLEGGKALGDQFALGLERSTSSLSIGALQASRVPALAGAGAASRGAGAGLAGARVEITQHITSPEDSRVVARVWGREFKDIMAGELG